MTDNIFDQVNQRIYDFVQRPENRRLIPGTGSYSTLFRGSLFGEEMSAAVAEHLNVRGGVGVLWLGTNPCVEGSLCQILKPNGDGDFPRFRQQMKSAFFGSRCWKDGGDSCPDWNPIKDPDNNWRVYRDVLDKIAQPDCVAMANFIPWGSRSSRELVTNLDGPNRSLLERLLAFADEINVAIVEALKPRLLVVPFSLGRNAEMNAVRRGWVSMETAEDCQPHSIQKERSGRTFRFVTGTCRRGGLTTHAAYVPHPSSLRLRANNRDRFVDELSGILAHFIGVV